MECKQLSEGDVKKLCDKVITTTTNSTYKQLVELS